MNIGLGGNLSSGKTALGMKLSFNRILETKKEFIANLENTLGRTMKNDKLILFVMENYENQKELEKVFFNKILFLDEIGNLVNARRSSSSLNELMLGLCMQLGKLDCDLLYTYQLEESQVDKQLRAISPIQGICQRINEKGELMFTKSRIVSEKVLVYVEWEIKLGGKIKKFKEVIDCTDIFPTYNTREIILLDRDRYKKK